MRPIMAPRAMMMAMWPRILPMPPSMVATSLDGSTPAARATRMLTSIKATKGWNLYLRTRNSSRAMPAAAMRTSSNGLMNGTPGGEG